MDIIVKNLVLRKLSTIVLLTIMVAVSFNFFTNLYGARTVLFHRKTKAELEKEKAQKFGQECKKENITEEEIQNIIVEINALFKNHFEQQEQAEQDEGKKQKARRDKKVEQERKLKIKREVEAFLREESGN